MDLKYFFFNLQAQINLLINSINAKKHEKRIQRFDCPNIFTCKLITVVLSLKSSIKAVDALKKLGVQIHTNTIVTDYNGELVTTKDGKTF